MLMQFPLLCMLCMLCMHVECLDLPPQSIPDSSTIKQLFRLLGAPENQVSELDNAVRGVDSAINNFWSYDCPQGKYIYQAAAKLKDVLRNMEGKYLSNFNNVIYGNNNKVTGNLNKIAANNLTVSGDRNFVFFDRNKDPYPIKGTGWVRTGGRFDINLQKVEDIKAHPQLYIFPQEDWHTFEQLSQLRKDLIANHPELILPKKK